MTKTIYMKQDALEGILSYAQMNYPNEGILLLQGRIRKDALVIESLVLPPLAYQDRQSSGFPLFMLPLDVSLMGIAHSHPSGDITPSPEDLNYFYGKIMVIVGYPYRDKEDMAVYTREGERVRFTVIP